MCDTNSGIQTSILGTLSSIPSYLKQDVERGLAFETEPQIVASNPAVHKLRFARPIPLGVSGSSIADLVPNRGCCGGTLGALVVNVVGVQFILSNKHVLAGDIVSGNNARISRVGDQVRQPGLIDVGCSNIPSDTVATVAGWAPIYPINTGKVNRVDVALARVSQGMVRSDGAIFGIGGVSVFPVQPTIGMRVAKSGRSSGVTLGRIVGIDATVDVEYSVECGSSQVFTARFTGQILIQSENATPFSQAGDSGSLIVTNTTIPSPVGLLFAGSSTVTVANRITEVLGTFGVKMVGIGVPGTKNTKTSNTVETKTLENIKDTYMGEIEAMSDDILYKEYGEDVCNAIKIKRKYTDKILSIPECVGCYIRRNDLTQNPELVIMVRKQHDKHSSVIAQHYDGLSTVVEIHTTFRAY